MKVSIVVSPFKENVPQGRTRTFHAIFARLLCAKLAKAGFAPYAPHLLCPQFLDEDSPEERAMGIEISKEMISRGDELCVWDAWGISSGMAHEIAHAMSLNEDLGTARMPGIRYFTKGEIPEWADLAERAKP